MGVPPPPLQPPKLSNTPRGHTLAGGGPRAEHSLSCQQSVGPHHRDGGGKGEAGVLLAHATVSLLRTLPQTPSATNTCHVVILDTVCML